MAHGLPLPRMVWRFAGGRRNNTDRQATNVRAFDDGAAG